MIIFFDAERYKTNNFARVSLIIVNDKLNEIASFDKWIAPSIEVDEYTKNIIGWDKEIETVDNINEKIKEFIENNIDEKEEIIVYCWSDKSDVLKLLEKDFEIVDLNELLKQIICDKEIKNNQLIVSRALNIKFPFYEEHNSIFEVRNLLEIYKKMKEEDISLLSEKVEFDENHKSFREKLIEQINKELLRYEIIWNYHNFKIRSDDDIEKVNNLHKVYISQYNEKEKTILLNSQEIMYESDDANLGKILERSINECVFIYDTNKTRDGIKKMLKVNNIEYAYALKQNYDTPK